MYGKSVQNSARNLRTRVFSCKILHEICEHKSSHKKCMGKVCKILHEICELLYPKTVKTHTRVHPICEKFQGFLAPKYTKAAKHVHVKNLQTLKISNHDSSLQ